jgi:hypothetical protein
MAGSSTFKKDISAKILSRERLFQFGLPQYFPQILHG